MKAKALRRTVRLEAGDVRALTVVRRGGRTRIVIHDQEAGMPLIQAMLSIDERKRLTRLLGG